MAETKKVTVTGAVVEHLGAPIAEAPEQGKERREMLRRVCDLEYSLTKTRDALRVIARGLEDMAEEHASADQRELSQDDVSMLYGAVNLLDCVALSCDQAFKGEA